MSAPAYINLSGKPKAGLGKKKDGLAPEDAFILATLEKLKKDLDITHSSLNNITDPVLIDSFIFEMNALHMRYKFYLRQCKEKGLVSACLD